MTTLLGLNNYQSEAMVVCLAASILWAGVLLLAAMHLERTGTARGDRLWIGVLLLAILPSLVAPSLAAFGVSLRAATPAAEIGESVKAAAPESAIAAAPRVVGNVAALEETFLPSITPDQATHALALLYVYGAFLALFIWLARQAGFLAASALAEPVRSENLLRAVDDWAFDFGVKAPKLKRSRHVSSVCVYGAVSPVILMPHDLDARVAGEDIALMCAHEIAHLQRGDTRLFTATALARVLFWFNPLVTRIAANVEMAAEEGADRLVIEAGVDRRAYASCFVKGLKFAAMKQSLLPALAPGFTPNDRQARRRRLDQILSMRSDRRTGFGARAALAGAASIAALIAVGQAAFAVDPEAAAEKKRAAMIAAQTDPAGLAAAAPSAPEPPEAFAAPDLAGVSEAPTPTAPPAPEAPVELAAPVSPVAPTAPIAPVTPAETTVVAHRLAFANGDSITDRMADDLEHRLLGDAEIADIAKYDISFTVDGKTHRFTSETPMTPEKRAHLRTVLSDLRAHRDVARADLEKARMQWRKDAEKFRADAARQVEAVKREFARTAPGERRFALHWQDEAIDGQLTAQEARGAAAEAERIALEAELEAIAGARDDLADAVSDGIDGALADLEAEEAALEDEAISDEDRRIMRRALSDARRSIEFSRRDHEREIERARRELDRRVTEIEIKLETLDAQSNDEN